MTLEELKKEALGRGYTRIQRDVENAAAVSLKDWNGFSPHAAGGPGSYATVTYHVEGNKVQVQKTLEADHWYILS